MNDFRKISSKNKQKARGRPKTSARTAKKEFSDRDIVDTEYNGIKIHKVSWLKSAKIEPPDRDAYMTVFNIARLANDDFGSLSAYMFEMLKFFEGAKRCSIYLGAKREIGGKRKTVLEHHMTIHTNGDLRTESLGKKEAIIDRYNPVLRSYIHKKPTLIDTKEGLKLEFKNLDRENDRCDVRQINNGLFNDAMAIVPFYYKEKQIPYGVIVMEGNLTCKGSNLKGLSKVYYSAHATVTMAVQTAVIFARGFDWTTRFMMKQDFEIQFKKILRNLIKAKQKNEQKSDFMILVDLDKFKSINDKYGYLTGDVVLKAAAEAMEKSVRSGKDLLCRWGGEEFISLSTSISKEDVVNIAKRIRENIKDLKVKKGKDEIRVTCSIGLVDVGAILDSLETRNLNECSKFIFERCNDLLNVAKENGRDRIAFYDENGKMKFLNDQTRKHL